MTEIELLRQMVADLTERVRALEARPQAMPLSAGPGWLPPYTVPSSPLPQQQPFTAPPWEVVCGDVGGRG